ncbi:MAG: rod shape-determining protein RodA [Acidimicrobiia bacterium]
MSVLTGPAVELVGRPQRSRIDFVLVGALGLIAVIGVVMVFTVLAPRLEALEVDRSQGLVRQLLFVMTGMILFTAGSLVNDRTWRDLAPIGYGLAIIMLLAVLSPLGDVRAGAQRWIGLGPFQLQPSELAKPAMILVLALLLAPAEVGKVPWSRLLRAIAVVAFPALLIFLQPDLGTMAVFGFVLVAMLFVAGATIRQLAALFGAGLIGLWLALRMDLLQEYQIQRITSFFDPSSDPLSSITDNYNQIQSQIAIGSGGLFGRGLFEGTQTNLAFVPAQATDFIYTAVGEQLGFFGGLIVLGLFAVVVWRLLMAAVSARDRFGMLVATGVAAMIGFHVFVNVGMTLGLLPVTGLPLPMMSHGGSSFASMALALGIAHAIWLRRTRVPGERHLL